LDKHIQSLESEIGFVHVDEEKQGENAEEGGWMKTEHLLLVGGILIGFGMVAIGLKKAFEH